MTGPNHYRQAEELAQKAHGYLKQGDGQESAAVWAAVAQNSCHPRPRCCHRARDDDH
jgi:hypothetical protein